MPKHMGVGRSWRTPAKHDLVRRILGQEVGAARNLPGARRLVWLDLTAGDAAQVDGEEWHKACSPGILAYHATKSPKPVEIRLHEIQPATYDRLLDNLWTHLPSLGYEQLDSQVWVHNHDHVILTALNMSGKDARVNGIGRGDAVFVVNDPNAISEWAMRDTFAAEITSRTWLFRSLSTMGCNPGGLKRIDIEARLKWFDAVEEQQAALPDHRDLVIAAIARDDAQWAYMLSTAWQWRSTTEKVIEATFRRFGRTALMSWYRQDTSAFQDTKLRLFLQKTERDQIRGKEGAWLAANQADRLAMIPRPDKPLEDDDEAEWVLFDIDQMGGAA
jgi:hypothetical protein